jgi:hypothetical protein
VLPNRSTEIVAGQPPVLTPGPNQLHVFKSVIAVGLGHFVEAIESGVVLICGLVPIREMSPRMRIWRDDGLQLYIKG